jgi:hypothetical protein
MSSPTTASSANTWIALRSVPSIASMLGRTCSSFTPTNVSTAAFAYRNAQPRLSFPTVSHRPKRAGSNSIANMLGSGQISSPKASRLQMLMHGMAFPTNSKSISARARSSIQGPRQMGPALIRRRDHRRRLIRPSSDQRIFLLPKLAERGQNGAARSGRMKRRSKFFLPGGRDCQVNGASYFVEGVRETLRDVIDPESRFIS